MMRLVSKQLCLLSGLLIQVNFNFGEFQQNSHCFKASIRKQLLEQNVYKQIAAHEMDENWLQLLLALTNSIPHGSIAAFFYLQPLYIS